MLLMVVFSSVLAATATTSLLGGLFNVDTAFFHFGEMPSLGLADLWLPVVVGCAVSVFAALFLLLARAINHLFVNKLKRIHHSLQLIAVFLLCGGAGLLARDFIGGGHELIVHINARGVLPLMLLLIFALKFLLVPLANVSGATGGLFIPTLALGALLGALLAELLIGWGVDENYYKVIIVLSVAGFMSAASRVPLSAVMLALEAMNGADNLLFVAISVSVSFMLLELTKLPAVNDIVLETTIRISTHDKEPKKAEISLEVKPDAFVAGKTVRDVLWPANTIVLSVTRAEHAESQNGERLTKDGDKELRAGDILKLRFQTYDEETTKSGLIALLGEQSVDFESPGIKICGSAIENGLKSLTKGYFCNIFTIGIFTGDYFESQRRFEKCSHYCARRSRQDDAGQRNAQARRHFQGKSKRRGQSHGFQRPRAGTRNYDTCQKHFGVLQKYENQHSGYARTRRLRRRSRASAENGQRRARACGRG